MTDAEGPVDAERQRLVEADAGLAPWRRWGRYLSERQWGTSWAGGTAIPALRATDGAVRADLAAGRPGVARTLAGRT
ncbi:hypothetical protein [Streptomyces sp. NBC_00582]|uniref:hypothetical protein n=1 Tax=Streptomyces sp. NBC_00582 TaxID=2975783 RepID=UPI002E7FC33F|nr:hypothetical protein [Streptomyces sp. NBC_00582]WUB66494.1 hypothetical protein OG852_41800 [Streptomyces sp. NBC_00582]